MKVIESVMIGLMIFLGMMIRLDMVSFRVIVWVIVKLEICRMSGFRCVDVKNSV